MGLVYMGPEEVSHFCLFLLGGSFFLRFASFFFVSSSLISHSFEDNGERLQFTAKHGEFPSDPVCTDPVHNFSTSADLPGFLVSDCAPLN